MNKIEFSRWYHQVGPDMAMSVAEFYGVSLTQAELWLSNLEERKKNHAIQTNSNIPSWNQQYVTKRICVPNKRSL